jgi:hypothetical protein
MLTLFNVTKNYGKFITLTNDVPTAIYRTLECKVFETENLCRTSAPYLALTERQENGKTKSDRDYSGIAWNAPNLEDVFYAYRDEVV